MLRCRVTRERSAEQAERKGKGKGKGKATKRRGKEAGGNHQLFLLPFFA